MAAIRAMLLAPVRRLSLVVQATDNLRTALRAGYWGKRLPGERELCGYLQISRITLRSALVHLEKEGWLKSSARRKREITGGPAVLEKSKPRVIALLSSDPLATMTTSSALLIAEVRATLLREGFLLDVHVSPACYSKQPGRTLEDLVQRKPAEVWLVLNSMEPLQRWFFRRRVPCLIVGGCVPGVSLPSVALDFRATCRHAGGFLRRKGHRHIALVLPDGVRGGEMDTEQGLRDALHGDPLSTITVVRHDGRARHLCMLLSRIMRTSRPPTAYLVARAVHALTVIMYLTKCGQRLPQDVAVLSRDDEAFLRHTVPDVTRYAASTTRFARRIAVAARQLADGRVVPPRPVLIIPELIEGETA
jgi:DNA-binding LacI/PurR family transcriptional regulator